MARIRFVRPPVPTPPEMFGGLPGRKSPWVTFSGSLLFHAVAIWSSAAYLHFLASLPPDPVERILHARILEITTHSAFQLQAPLLASAGDRSASSAAPRARLGQRNTGLDGNSKPAPEDAGKQSLPPDRFPGAKFRMPPEAAVRRVPQTLSQLDLPPTLDLREDLRVPELALLSQTTRVHIVKPFVAPPPRPQATQIPSQVVLELRPPIVEPQSAGYAKRPELFVHTTIPPPVGAKSPVASDWTLTELDPGLTVRGDTASEAPNIISLPSHPIPLSASIVLPPLNQVSEKDIGSGDGDRGAGPREQAELSSTNVGQGPARATTAGTGGSAAGMSHSVGSGTSAGTGGSAAGVGHGPASGTNAGRGGSASGHGGSGASGAAGTAKSAGSGAAAGEGSSAGLTGTGSAAGPSAERASGAGPGNATSNTETVETIDGGRFVKIARPITGQYEIAIVQSTVPVPGSQGLLKGRPVYSVYIPIGTRKEWILQYCLPVTDAQDPDPEPVVELGTMTPVSAPYAFTLVRPVVSFRVGARYGFIHGYVNTSGRFEHAAEVGEPVIQEIAGVLEALAKWEFRPASKDGVATTVEVLLCIPSV